jgi:hypothetical protein
MKKSAIVLIAIGVIPLTVLIYYNVYNYSFDMMTSEPSFPNDFDFNPTETDSVCSTNPVLSISVRSLWSESFINRYFH